MEKTAAAGYLEYLENIMENTINPQVEFIEQAAKLCADSLEKGGRIYAFGSGHSAMVAEDIYARAGGLALVHAIVPDEVWAHNLPRKSTYLERLEGYGKALCTLYRVEPEDTMIVISNSGRNPLPVEMALTAKELGCHVIAITSLSHTGSIGSRHSSGKRLFEIADIALNNGAPKGDAGFEVSGCPTPVGPVSNITGMALMQALIAQTVEDCTKAGMKLPIFKSSNLDGADEYNDELFNKYYNFWK